MSRSSNFRHPRVTAPETEEALDLVFHALADRTRRAIVRRLSDGPASISELAIPFAMSLPAVSKHVRVLESAALVSITPIGGVRQCALAGEPFDDISRWINAHRAMWTNALDRLERHAKSERSNT